MVVISNPIGGSFTELENRLDQMLAKSVPLGDYMAADESLSCPLLSSTSNLGLTKRIFGRSVLSLLCSYRLPVEQIGALKKGATITHRHA